MLQIIRGYKESFEKNGIFIDILAIFVKPILRDFDRLTV